jgi:hypothetical protein
MAPASVAVSLRPLFANPEAGKIVPSPEEPIAAQSGGEFLRVGVFENASVG